MSLELVVVAVVFVLLAGAFWLGFKKDEEENQQATPVDLPTANPVEEPKEVSVTEVLSTLEVTEAPKAEVKAPRKKAVAKKIKKTPKK